MYGLSVPQFICLFSTRYLVDALGFEKHMRQIRERRGEGVPRAWYARPYMYGLRLERSKIVGTGDVITVPHFVSKPDYEFEIAAFFRESIKTTNLSEAIAFVKANMFFTILNDMSARDLQAEDMQLPLWVGPSKGVIPKSFGPRWVHASKIPLDENGVPKMRMRLRVNNELRCDSCFQTIYFNEGGQEARSWGFAEIIAWFGAQNQGFEQGDLLGSGTVGNGSIAEFAPKIGADGKVLEPAKYPWLKDGDVVRMEAEHIGVLENKIHIVPKSDLDISELHLR